VVAECEHRAQRFNVPSLIGWQGEKPVGHCFRSPWGESLIAQRGTDRGSVWLGTLQDLPDGFENLAQRCLQAADAPVVKDVPSQVLDRSPCIAFVVALKYEPECVGKVCDGFIQVMGELFEDVGLSARDKAAITLAPVEVTVATQRCEE